MQMKKIKAMLQVEMVETYFPKSWNSSSLGKMNLIFS